MTFARLSAANVYYGLFDKLQEGLSSTLQITTKSDITTYYGKYGKLLKSSEDQLRLDNNEITRDIANVGTAEDAGDGKDTGDTEGAGNVEDIEDTGDAGDKKADRGNERRKQKDAEIGNNDEDDTGDQEAGKVGYDEVGDRVGIGRVLDGIVNQDNWHAIVADMEDSNDKVTIAMDPTGGVLVDVLAHSFSPSSPQFNSSPGIIAPYFSQSHNYKFKFLFISLLTLIQGQTEFLKNKVVVWLTLLVPSSYRSNVKRFVAITTRAFSIVYICCLCQIHIFELL